jgi:hypothetical protein
MFNFIIQRAIEPPLKYLTKKGGFSMFFDIRSFRMKLSG